MDTFAVHVVYGISTTATNTDHFNDTILFLWLAKV
jgi:hypothetical protein